MFRSVARGLPRRQSCQRLVCLRPGHRCADNLSEPGVTRSGDAARMSATHECVRHTRVSAYEEPTVFWIDVRGFDPLLG